VLLLLEVPVSAMKVVLQLEHRYLGLGVHLGRFFSFDEYEVFFCTFFCNFWLKDDFICY